MNDRHDPFERAVYELVVLAREVRRLAPREGVQPTEHRWLGEVLDLVTEARERGKKAA